MRYCIILLLLWTSTSLAVGIPNINWTRAGVFEVFDKKSIPHVNFEVVKSSFSADVSDDAVMQNILKEYPTGVVIFMPEGEYHFKEQIKLHSRVILRGEGIRTHLKFNLDKEVDCIVAKGKMSKEPIELDASAGKGQSFLTCLNNADIEAGEYLYLADNDERLIESWWSKGKTGQFVVATTTSPDRINIVGQLRRDFPMEYQPALYQCDFVEYVGVEQLYITNEKQTAGQTSNIAFRYAKNCWVGGIWSEYCNYTHVLLEFASHCEVMGSQFKDAHDHGNGGKAYGITLQFGTSDCLLMGNDLENLRHSILLQAGANGNVILKNNSEEAEWTDVRLPEDAAGDMVLHGNYPYANLFEDNVCETIVVDNTHGTNGPDNFFFKNLVRGYGIYVHRKSPGQALVNNQIKDWKFPRGRYKVKGKQFEWYNTYKGKKRKPRFSYEREEKESYFY